jgi:hypothetical protein
MILKTKILDILHCPGLKTNKFPEAASVSVSFRWNGIENVLLWLAPYKWLVSAPGPEGYNTKSCGALFLDNGRSSKFQPHLAAPWIFRVLGEQNIPCLKMGALLTSKLNFHHYSGVTFKSLKVLGVSFQSIRNSGKQLGQCTWPVTEPTMPPSHLAVRCKHNLLLRMFFSLTNCKNVQTIQLGQYRLHVDALTVGEILEKVSGRHLHEWAFRRIITGVPRKDREG